MPNEFKFKQPQLTAAQLQEILEITEKKEGNIITAEDKEGKEIEFDLEKIHNHWTDFYTQNNLKELAKSLQDISIELSPEQIATIKEKAKRGFDYFILLPSTEIQQQHLPQIKQETEKEMKGLGRLQQYYREGTYLSDSVNPNFPDKILTLNRPANKPYLLFIKNIPKVEGETKGKTAQDLRQAFKQKQETGLTLAEYLIFQRDYTQEHIKQDNPHPDCSSITWLLDSESSPDSTRSSRILGADWDMGDHYRVMVYSVPAGDSFSGWGARSSVIFEI